MNQEILENSVLMKSIKEDLRPKDFYEKYENRLLMIDTNTSKEKLQTILEEYKKEGFTHAKLHNHSLLAIKERSEEELIAYRLKRVNHPILLWFKDGLRRAKYMIREKEASLLKYELKVEEFSKKTNMPQSMMNKLQHKKDRVKYYQDKITEIEFLIAHPETFRYQDLDELPAKYFTTGSGWLK